MGEWNFLSDLLESIQAHAPMVGRIWLLLMLIFRILILGTVGGDIFEDEQEEFECNTLQPGCKQVCYSKAFPISPYRFWVFHIVILSIPALLFVVYAMHQSSKSVEKQEKIGLLQNKETPTRGTPRIRKCYIVHVLIRLLAEVGLVVSQCALYGFTIEPRFLCVSFPCPHTVDCFVSRPMEKTVFLIFYFVIGVISAVISLVELLHILLKICCSSQSLEPCERQNQSNIHHERERHMHSLPLLHTAGNVKPITYHHPATQWHKEEYPNLQGGPQSDTESSLTSKSTILTKSVRSSTSNQSSVKKPPLNI